MVSSILSKITWGILFGLFIFGMISAFQILGQEKLKEKWQENPRATGLGFVAFSLGMGSSTPVWCLIKGEEKCKLEIPYPDNTDLIGLFIAAILAITIIKTTNLKNNYLFAIPVFLMFLISGWVLWKILMYYIYLWGANQIGLTYIETAQVRQDVIKEGGKIAIPLLILTLFTFIAGLKLLPRKWN